MPIKHQYWYIYLKVVLAFVLQSLGFMAVPTVAVYFVGLVTDWELLWFNNFPDWSVRGYFAIIFLLSIAKCYDDIRSLLMTERDRREKWEIYGY